MTASLRSAALGFDIKPARLFEDTSFPALASNISMRRLKAGETLYVEGESAPICYQVIEGVLKEYNTLEDGRRQVADFYGPGEIFGISELSRQLHTAEAISDCAVRCLPRDSYLKAIAASPQLTSEFVETLMTRLHRARERMIMLGRMNATQRVACFLRRLIDEQEKDKNVRLFMSRQDIADHLGLTIETVCRVLTDLKKREIIEMPTARVFNVTDMAALDGCALNCGGLN